MKILIVENDEIKNKKLFNILSKYGGESKCEQAFNFDRGLVMASMGKFDLLVVGANDNVAAIKSIIAKVREESGAPIVILHDDLMVSQKVDFLNSGADICLPYDSDQKELFAVIGAIMRRFNQSFGTNIYEFKNLKVNFFEKTVQVNGENIGIVAKMYDLLECLIRYKEIILSKETLFNKIWGFDSETAFSVVEVYVSKLRKVLSTSGLDKHLLTVKNAGYSWTEKEKNNQ